MSLLKQFFTSPEPWNVTEYRRRAQKILPRPVFDFVDGGADDETTLRRNLEAFTNVTFRPRVAKGFASYDTSGTVLGEKLDVPVLLAPTGLPGLVHKDAEIAAVRAAESVGTRIILSTGSSFSLEEVAAAAKHHHWFQLYPWRDEDFVSALIARAHNAGYSTLCITLDVPVVGHRERDTKNGFTIPPRISIANAANFATHPRWLMSTLRARNFTMRNFLDGELTSDLKRPMSTLQRNLGLINPLFSWNDVARIRDEWPGKLVVKGIMHPDDAVQAIEVGVDGLVVSNHGGRQLDGCQATLEALPAIVERVAGRVQVLMDGGVRRGSDVVKAVALGADACLVGRPWLYGLACGGTEGVARVLGGLRDDIGRTLALLGCQSLGDVDRTCLNA